jgi:hypothetical protein
MKKTTGWLLTILGVLWGAVVIKNSPLTSQDGLASSRLLGAVMVPALFVVGGLYLAGVIKSKKKD